jgi:hypothetical protein
VSDARELYALLDGLGTNPAYRALEKAWETRAHNAQHKATALGTPDDQRPVYSAEYRAFSDVLTTLGRTMDRLKSEIEREDNQGVTDDE